MVWVRSSLSYRKYSTIGGAGRNRTDDLYNAIVALSQLSYGPPLTPAPKIMGWWRRASFLVSSRIFFVILAGHRWQIVLVFAKV